MTYSEHGRSDHAAGFGHTRCQRIASHRPSATRSVTLPRSRTGAFEDADCEAAAHAVWTQVGEDRATDRTARVAARRVADRTRHGRPTKSRRRTRVRTVGLRAGEDTCSEANATFSRASRTRDPYLRSGRVVLFSVRKQDVQARRGHFGNAGVCPRKLPRGPSRSPEDELQRVRRHRAGACAITTA